MPCGQNCSIYRGGYRRYMEIRWLGEVCSALPSSGGRGHSCDHQAMPLIETLYATLSTLRSREVLGRNGYLCVVNLVHRRLKPPRGGRKHSWECRALPSSGGRRI